MRQLWVFLAYVLAARLAILLALPPGYASPIWPAAGIAMAATIAWGPSLTIAVFFGSIATNVRPEELLAHPLDQILIQICLALGSSIQAYLGSLIYNALEKRLTNSVSVKRLALETVLLGPVACLSAASLATSALTAFHVIEAKAFLANWTWWWLGDSFGAGVLCPILIRMQRRVRSRLTRSAATRYLLTPAAICGLIVLSLTVFLHNSNIQNQKSLEHTVKDIHQSIQHDVNQIMQHMQMLTEISRSVDPLTVIESYQNPEQKSWRDFELPQVLWVPRVLLEDRNGFEKAFGNAHQDFTILEKTPTGHLTPALSRNVYWPLIFKTPHDFNLLPPGYDIGSLEAVNDLLQRTWEGSDIVVSPVLTLGNNKKAILLMKRGFSSKTTEFSQGVFISIVTLERLIKPVQPINNQSFQLKISGGKDDEIFRTWFGEDLPEVQLSRIALYGNFRNYLQISNQTLTLQIDFPADAFSSGRTLDAIFVTLICILLAFAANVLIISQQDVQAVTAPNSKSQNDELLLNYESLRDADRIKANLLANISHQIRSPLHGILGLLDMLRGTGLDARQRSSIDTIIANCQSMRLMLDDIYTYSTMEIGQLTLNSDEFLIGDFLRDLTSVYELAAEERQNNFKAQLDLPQKIRVRGDQRKLHRVLSHLLSDAIRRTQKGRISFAVKTDSENGLAFSIESVRGQQDEIYDNEREFGNNKAYQPTEVFNLKTCEKLVQMMGGHLTLERPSSLSSLVTFTLPIPTVQSREQEIGPVTRPHQDILVVDDNSINLTVAAGLLGKLGYSVDTAVDGKIAVEKAKQKRYDVIFMDCQMPHMDGFEATQLIRAHHKPDHGPLIIALTANALDGAREQAAQAGMDSIIIKPISLDILQKTIGYARKMQPQATPSNVSIMDFKAFSLGLGDDHDLIQMAVLRYFEEIDGIMSRLRMEIERNDAVAVAKTAHTLKGMTALFAAQALVEANRNLEVAGKDGRVSEFPTLIKRIESLTELLKAELRKLIDEKNLPKKEKEVA